MTSNTQQTVTEIDSLLIKIKEGNIALEQLRKVLADDPTKASDQFCYRCHEVLGTAEYRISETGMLSHATCPWKRSKR